MAIPVIGDMDTGPDANPAAAHNFIMSRSLA